MPTQDRYTYSCGAAVVGIVDDGLGCAAAWSSASSWLKGAVPLASEAVEVVPPLEGSSTCVTVDSSNATVTKVTVRLNGLPGSLRSDRQRSRVRVVAGGRLRVHGRAPQDGAQCLYPSVAPTAYVAPPSPSPTWAPTPGPTEEASPAPSVQPTPAYLHRCGGVGWAAADGACGDWNDASHWSTGAVPGRSDLAEIVPAPGAPSACVIVDVARANASAVVVRRPRADSSRAARLRVTRGGRLVVARSDLVAAGAAAGIMCTYPTAAPSGTPAPSAPTPAPTRLPTALPSAAPTPAPTPWHSAPPSPSPSGAFYYHLCGAVALGVADDSLACLATWSSPATWLGGVVPARGASCAAGQNISSELTRGRPWIAAYVWGGVGGLERRALVCLAPSRV